MKIIQAQGVSLPAIGFGTSGLRGWWCRRMVRLALKLGYRHIDCAQAYGNEKDVGRAIADSPVPRTEVFLSTKLEQVNLVPGKVNQAVDESLSRFGLPSVDLLMIHWPSDQVPMRDTFAAFRELQRAGRIHHIGVCNFTLRLLQEAVEECGVIPLCNQVEYHPFLSQATILPYMREHGIALVAYSPLARGAVPKDPILQGIGAKYGKSAAQVALNWLTRQPLVAAIPKASSEANCRANLAVFDFDLTEEDLNAIDGLDKDRRVINPSWAPVWDQG